MLRIFDMGGVVTNTAELALVEKNQWPPGIKSEDFYYERHLLPGYHNGALRGVPVGGVGEKRSFEP